MKSKKYIKQIEKNGFTLIPGFLSKSKVKKLTKLVNNFYEIDAKKKILHLISIKIEIKQCITCNIRIISL